MFCVWLTRVRDFKRFVNETGYAGDSNEAGYAGDSWKKPGFAQTGDHPVCGVNFEDANKFCDWLTGKELGMGLLKSAQRYGLPTDAEWSLAVGPTKYPWGEDYPPPSGAGNYNTSGTSPVGAFQANAFGLFDLGGNLWEWCDDYYQGNKKFQMFRGASFANRNLAGLMSSYRDYRDPGVRYADIGFRCVVVRSSSRRDVEHQAAAVAQETLRRNEEAPAAAAGSQANACINNLVNINGAKEQWALENKLPNGAVPGDSDLFGAKGYIDRKPGCPAGGTYTLNAVGTAPTCSISGHTLP